MSAVSFQRISLSHNVKLIKTEILPFHINRDDNLDLYDVSQIMCHSLEDFDQTVRNFGVEYVRQDRRYGQNAKTKIQKVELFFWRMGYQKRSLGGNIISMPGTGFWVKVEIDRFTGLPFQVDANNHIVWDPIVL
jgi:hypothetical protein